MTLKRFVIELALDACLHPHPHVVIRMYILINSNSKLEHLTEPGKNMFKIKRQYKILLEEIEANFRMN